MLALDVTGAQQLDQTTPRLSVTVDHQTVARPRHKGHGAGSVVLQDLVLLLIVRHEAGLELVHTAGPQGN